MRHLLCWMPLLVLTFASTAASAFRTTRSAGRFLAPRFQVCTCTHAHMHGEHVGLVLVVRFEPNQPILRSKTGPNHTHTLQATRQQRAFATITPTMQSASLATKGVNVYVYDHCPFCVRGKAKHSVKAGSNT